MSPTTIEVFPNGEVRLMARIADLESVEGAAAASSTMAAVINGNGNGHVGSRHTASDLKDDRRRGARSPEAKRGPFDSAQFGHFGRLSA